MSFSSLSIMLACAAGLALAGAASPAEDAPATVYYRTATVSGLKISIGKPGRRMGR